MGGRMTTHGMHNTKIYTVWISMKSRCNIPTDTAYKNYGAKGITVCERWLNSFENFFADMGHPEKGMSIDRKDSRGNYEPENCKWSTRIEQMRNMTSNKIITFKGESRIISEWAEYLNINYNTLYYRLKRWSVEKSLTAPIRYKEDL